MVSSILTVCADNNEITGLLSVKPVTSQRLKGTETLSFGSCKCGPQAGSVEKDHLIYFYRCTEGKRKPQVTVQGQTALKQLCLVLKLDVLLQRISVGLYAHDPSSLNLRAEVARVVIRTLLLSTFPPNLVICAHL